MINSPTILIKFLILKGFLVLTARGTAIPMIKMKDGKMRSAQVIPFHSEWSSWVIGWGPELSTRIIPTMVRPLWMSREVSRFLG